jgi:hypothetical protein
LEIGNATTIVRPSIPLKVLSRLKSLGELDPVFSQVAPGFFISNVSRVFGVQAAFLGSFPAFLCKLAAHRH